MKTLSTILFVLLAAGAVMIAAGAKSPATLLQEGIYAEETEGNLDSAMKIYQQVIDDKTSSRANVAQAMYRLGMCNMKKQNDAAAQEIFDKIITDYSDQQEVVDKVKVMMADIDGFDPAALMPADTKVYVELGSPGRQLEKILTMFAGTPMANPLAMIAGKNGGQAAGLMAGLLNPSMMAEFKKIKGMAVGVTGFTQNNNPPTIAVLYPGKSDALRGILIAALSMVGTPGEAMEGMQRVNIQNFAGVVYDDKIVVYAQPASQLDWVVKQYKGIAKDKSLATANKSFAKLSKQQRQNNVSTVWAKVDEAYKAASSMFPNGQIPQELQMINAFVDFENIDEYTESFSIEQDGLLWKANLNFKEGHKCLAYDMIRTPNVDKASLQNIPADAVAVVSFALSAPDERNTDTVRAKIKNITGLDIGREIFANLEQVTLFATPQKQANAFFPANMGLVMTSHNPAQTRQILSTMLSTASLQFGGSPTGGLDLSASKYQVANVNGTPLYCYIEQMDKATVLSLNPDVTKASVDAIKSGNTAAKNGRFSGYISRLSPDASKLVLINAGGAIRLLYPAIIEGKVEKEQMDELKNQFEQLALAADNTVIEFNTQEQLNQLSMNMSLTGIPKLNEVFTSVNQISNIMNKAKSEGIAKKLRQSVPSTIMPAATPPVIDGNVDDVWAAAKSYKLTKTMYAPISSENDLSATYKTMWDKDNLYVLVDVTDDKLVNDTPDQMITLPTGSTDIPWWYDDCVEIYIDADNSKSNQYDNYDGQYHFDWDANNPTMGVHHEHGKTENLQYAIKTTEKGYRVEVKFPWATIGAQPATGKTIGLDVHINDDDDGGERDTKLAWHDSRDTDWDNPQSFGNAALAGLVGWWKLDETEGYTAKDSSGNNHDGSVIGNAKWTQGKVGGAIELDGTSAFVRIADKQYFKTFGDVSVCAWVNVRSTPNQWAGIVTKGDNSWRLSMYDYQRMFHCSVTNWDKFVIDGQTEVAANQWHYVAAVYDGQKMCLYVDGKVDSCRDFKGSIGQNDYDVLIGENAEQTGRFFSGMIDDVRIYNYALSADKVWSLYEGK